MPVRASLLPSSTACVLGPRPPPSFRGGRARKAAAAPCPVLERMGSNLLLSPAPVGPAGGLPPTLNQSFNQVDLGSGRDTR